MTSTAQETLPGAGRGQHLLRKPLAVSTSTVVERVSACEASIVLGFVERAELTVGD